jgi:hypothetical protein
VAAMVIVLPAMYTTTFGVLLVASGFATLVLRFVNGVWLQGVAQPGWEALTNIVPESRRNRPRAFLNGGPTQVRTMIAGVLSSSSKSGITSRPGVGGPQPWLGVRAQRRPPLPRPWVSGVASHGPGRLALLRRPRRHRPHRHAWCARWWVLASGRRRSTKRSEAITRRARNHPTQPTPRPARRRSVWRVVARAHRAPEPTWQVQGKPAGAGRTQRTERLERNTGLAGRHPEPQRGDPAA